MPPIPPAPAFKVICLIGACKALATNVTPAF